LLGICRITPSLFNIKDRSLHGLSLEILTLLLEDHCLNGNALAHLLRL